MIINPIIPIWAMAIICILLLVIKRRGKWPFIRQIMIVVLLFVINLRFMFPGEQLEGSAEGTEMNVLFVVDNTISMLARDFGDKNTERLEAVYADCEYITKKLDGAKFSVITFANTANIIAPFTDNTEYINSVIGGIYPIDELYARGSSLNTPIDAIKTFLEDNDDKAKKFAIFFISDGEITDESKLESYSGLSDLIYGGAVLGYGTDKGGEMYLQSYSATKPEKITTFENGREVAAISRIDETNLKQIASDLGISYVNMNNRNGLDSALSDVKSKAPAKLAVKLNKKTADGYKDIYYYLAIPMLLLLMYEAYAFTKVRKGKL